MGATTSSSRTLNNISFFLLLQVFGLSVFSQEFAAREVVSPVALYEYLKDSVKEEIEKKSVENIAAYFRDKFSERYYFDWRNIDDRIQTYKELYPQQGKVHSKNAADHMGKFRATTPWVLPFDHRNGGAVDAYAMRHLARQHKMVDIALQFNYGGKDPKYLDYFTEQMESLNKALHSGDYEKISEGNGVYEAFRSGYRVLNWLWVHNIFLSAEAYSDEEQLTTISTLLQHAAHLYEENPKFKPGNHQTRGMSVLAMLAILFRDFEDSEKWLEHSLEILEQHLEEEINDDGFQFERSVHYHISDIGNYYNVFRLAQLSDIPLDDSWNRQMNSLFTTLAKIAYPDKSAPVLQDDTDTPWAEKNNISEIMTLGYLLFGDPELGFFAADRVSAKMYWFLNKEQLENLEKINKKSPKPRSLAFQETGYYIMREGWNPDDMMMIVSAGLDDKKPDHQHGDMLGIQAMSNGRVLLPNYQVRYSLNDLEFFKNSMVKTVALVDEELQGKEYTSNQGGSGFGKFRNLPEPMTLAWKSNGNLDLFVGSHDGFENRGVSYSRQVIFVKNDFWIVKDNFRSKGLHSYKQVWQGHYSLEHSPKLLRATYDNGSGFDILQLKDIDTIEIGGKRGKEWIVSIKNDNTNFSFISLLYPFEEFDDRLQELDFTGNFAGWQLNSGRWSMEGKEAVALNKQGQGLFFNVNDLSLENSDINFKFSGLVDVYVKIEDKTLWLQSLNGKQTTVEFSGTVCGTEGTFHFELGPGESLECLIDN